MRGSFSLVIAAFCLALTPIFARGLEAAVTALDISLIRFWVGGLALLVIMLGERIRDPLGLLRELHTELDAEVLVLGTILAVEFALYFMSLERTSIAHTMFLVWVVPVVLSDIGDAIMGKEIRRYQLSASIIGALGLGVILTDKTGVATLAGDLLAIGAGILYGLFLMGLRRHERTHSSLPTTLYLLIFAGFILAPFTILNGPSTLDAFSPPFLWSALGIGAIATGPAYYLLSYSAERVEAHVSALLLMLSTPAISTVLAAVLLGESIGPATITGILLLLASGTLIETETDITKYMRRGVKI